MNRDYEDAEIAYNAYRNHTGGVSLISQQPIPEWENLRSDIKDAWAAAAHALRETLFCPVHFRLEHSDQLDPFTCIACMRNERDELRAKAGPITKHTSDGFHTFEELYEHRFELWMALCRNIATTPELGATEIWRCKLNSDGTSWDGWFLLGADGVTQITYHLPIRLWDRCKFACTYDEPHAWDGHTSADVLERLREL